MLASGGNARLRLHDFKIGSFEKRQNVFLLYYTQICYDDEYEYFINSSNKIDYVSNFNRHLEYVGLACGLVF